MRECWALKANQPSEWTPDSLARRGGWAWVINAGVGRNLDGSKAAQAIDLAQRARWLAARNGQALRVLTAWRADVYEPHELTTAWREFDPSWALGGVDPKRATEILQAWVSDPAWSIMKSERFPDADWRRLVLENMAAASWPQLYYAGNAGTASILAVVCDLRIPAFRSWAVEHALETLRVSGADALLIAAKLGWHEHGSPERRHPGYRPESGGVLFESPYGPGEFEAAFAEHLRELHAAGVGFVLNTAPSRPRDGRDRWAWMPTDLRDLPIGELAIVQ